MAAQISIPITDDGDQCNDGYIVEYKLQGEESYTTLYPPAFTTPIVIGPVLEASTYDVRIKRMCCNGATSNWTEIEVVTTI